MKKLNCLILCFTMLFVSIFTATQKVDAEIIKIGVITETGDTKVGVILRQDATTNSKKILNISDGVSVTVLGSKNDISNSVNPSTGNLWAWYQISYTSSGQTYTGFVREDLIRVSEYNTDPTFEQQLSDFPASYHSALIQLHAMYPNWVFRADKLNITFDEAVALEDFSQYKLINGTYLSLRSMRDGSYDWPTGTWISYEGGWYGASRELIAYYMDPRNFLNANDIFVYMKQGYDANTQTLQGVNEIVKGTFMDTTITDPNDEFYNRTYSEAIMEAAVRSSVNPYIIASTIIQEQGTDGATLGKGTTYNGTTVYNFMHWRATGKTDADIINNGAKYAYNNGWTTPSKSIIGGATMYGSGYVSKGQDTYFYKNYNITGSADVSHQYAQNVADSYSSAKKLSKMYADNNSINLTFRIPVYKDNSLPSTISPYPEKSNNLNNYYFNSIQAYGLTPSFDRFTYEYSLSVGGDTSIYVELPSGASLASGNSFNLVQGDNTVKLTVKAQTGFTNDYVINVNATSPCTLTITANISDISAGTVKKGDTNGDNNITTSDLANIRLHLLRLISLDGNNLLGADTNGDGNISTSDLANVRLHLLELINLS